VPHAVSADPLHGCEPFNLQNKFCRGDIRPCGSADHLGRLEEERRGDGEAQFFGGLEVEDQLELGGLLHGQVSGLGTLQDL
jgi:hypothetical protein